MEATKTLVHAFVSSRLDYCNSVLAGVSGQQQSTAPQSGHALLTQVGSMYS